MIDTFLSIFFFFNDTATTEIYPLSLHDALPICQPLAGAGRAAAQRPSRLSPVAAVDRLSNDSEDRKSTRLNSSHVAISYAVFCLKKKKKKKDKARAYRTLINKIKDIM